MPPPASSPFEIRPAVPAEYEAVGELTVAGYDADGHLTMASGEPDAYYARWLGHAAPRGEGGGLLVAVDASGALLGTVTWCPPGSPFREVATHDQQGEFRTLAVSPGARGRGVGRALVAECLDRARSLGLTEVVMCSLPDMTPAHRLYTSIGFGRRPDLDWSPADGIHLWGFGLTLQATPAVVVRTVTPADTARAVGSGDLDVLGTPVLIAWCEAATCAALDLAAHQTSVGTRIEMAHVAASPVGTEVTTTAELEHLDDRRARFAVTAQDAAGTVLARGTVERAIVDRERFLSRL